MLMVAITKSHVYWGNEKLKLKINGSNGKILTALFLTNSLFGDKTKTWCQNQNYSLVKFSLLVIL